MKLFYSGNSPYARKVRVMLTELGLEFDAIAIDLDRPPTEFPLANPNLRVPCLVDGKRTLYESNLILEYLLQTYGAQSAPGEVPPLARSMVRTDRYWDDLLMLTTVETLLDSGLNAFHLQRDHIKVGDSHTLQREMLRIQTELDWLEPRIGPHGFVPGVLSIVDLNLAITLAWLDFRKPAPWRGRPNLEALVARFENRPSFAMTRPGA